MWLKESESSAIAAMRPVNSADGASMSIPLNWRTAARRVSRSGDFKSAVIFSRSAPASLRGGAGGGGGASAAASSAPASRRALKMTFALREVVSVCDETSPWVSILAISPAFRSKVKSDSLAATRRGSFPLRVKLCSVVCWCQASVSAVEFFARVETWRDKVNVAGVCCG